MAAPPLSLSVEANPHSAASPSPITTPTGSASSPLNCRHLPALASPRHATATAHLHSRCSPHLPAPPPTPPEHHRLPSRQPAAGSPLPPHLHPPPTPAPLPEPPAPPPPQVSVTPFEAPHGGAPPPRVPLKRRPPSRRPPPTATGGRLCLRPLPPSPTSISLSASSRRPIREPQPQPPPTAASLGSISLKAGSPDLHKPGRRPRGRSRASTASSPLLFPSSGNDSLPSSLAHHLLGELPK